MFVACLCLAPLRPWHDADAMQYLCCELEDLQDSGKMPPLKVHDIAHTAWRMRVGTELQTAVADCTKVTWAFGTSECSGCMSSSTAAIIMMVCMTHACMEHSQDSNFKWAQTMQSSHGLHICDAPCAGAS